MKNYIIAELYRLRRRRPRLVLLFLVYVAIILSLSYIRSQLTWNTVAFIGTFEGSFGVAGLFVCLVEFLFVYASDFKAGIMQAAIGRGMSRAQVVLAKYLEIAIVNAMSLGVLWLLILGFGFATGARPGGGQILEMLVVYVVGLLNEVICTGIVACVLFLLQNAGIAAVIYAALFWDPLQLLFSLLSSKFKFIVSLHLRDFCFTVVTERFEARLILGQFDFLAFLLMVLYILAAYFVTVWIFKKKELEF